MSYYAASRELQGRHFRPSRPMRSLSLLSDQAEMKRVDLYIKVELELDEEEKPERVAAEICRQLERMYVVRSAEVSNAVTRE